MENLEALKFFFGPCCKKLANVAHNLDLCLEKNVPTLIKLNKQILQKAENWEQLIYESHRVLQVIIDAYDVFYECVINAMIEENPEYVQEVPNVMKHYRNILYRLNSGSKEVLAEALGD